MKVLLISVPFAPSVGGIETVSAALAEELTALGCEVVVVTRTPAAHDIDRSYRVVRKVSAPELLRLTRWSDVVFHNNISLREAWPLVLSRKPWVVAHHMWLPRSGKNLFAAFFKRLALHAARKNIAVSNTLADDLAVSCTVIPNPYDDSRFRRLPDVERTIELVFVGRLVSDKGVSLLLDALSILKSRMVLPSLSIVGGGPEEAALRQQTSALGLEGQVRFVGVVTGEELVGLLNRHQIIVIPSLWREPFGVVALEGAACGCVPVGASGSGLADAIGACGVIFKRGDSADLASQLEAILLDSLRAGELRSRAPSHLQLHHKRIIANQYLRVFRSALPA